MRTKARELFRMQGARAWTDAQYLSLGYAPASTLVASIALVLSAFPFVFLRYGEALRARSRVARAITLSKH